MTDTIAFITDTHLFRQGDGFHRQPPRIDLMPAITEGLKKQLAEARVDLLIHGGDIVEHANEENIPAGLDMLSGFGVKTVAVLGNHDMISETSCATYHSLAADQRLQRLRLGLPAFLRLALELVDACLQLRHCAGQSGMHTQHSADRPPGAAPQSRARGPAAPCTRP